MSNFMKIRQVGAELLHAGGRTDMTKTIVPYRSFANAPKNSLLFKSLTHSNICFWKNLNMW